MSKPQDHSSESIHLKDLLLLLNRGKYRILIFTVIGGLLLFLFGLTRPVFFHSEATFKDRGSPSQMLPFRGFDSLFAMNTSSSFQNEAKSLLLSRKLLARLSDQLGLQASIARASSRSGAIQRIIDNLFIEYSYLRSLKSYPVPDLSFPLKISKINYLQPFPLSLKLAFCGGEQFQVIDSESGELLGTGEIGMVYKNEKVQFRVDCDKELGSADAFTIVFHPLENVVNSVRNRLVIAPDKEDGSLLTLQFIDQDRKMVSTVLNTLMDIYQSYMSEEQARISSEQIAYLDKRKKEMRADLQKTLYSYASDLSSEINDFGFVMPSEGMHYITEQLQLLCRKQMEMDFALERFQKLDEKRCFYQTCDYPELFNEFIAKIRQLDAQTDQVEMALRTHSSKNLMKWKEGFSQQIKNLHEMRVCKEDAKILRTSLESETYPLPSVQLMGHPHYMVSFWNHELELRLRNLEEAHSWEKDSSREEYNNYRFQFMGYLDNLIHYLEVNESLVKDRMEHQQAPTREFQGIDLNTALQLFVSYHKQLNDIENQMIQYKYMIDQLEDPKFELSSFSSLGHHDPILTNFMHKASEYVVAIQDDSNRGSKEKLRMKSELDALQRFYALHLQQSWDLAEVQTLQIREKIESLQSSVLDLLQQQRSILDNQFLEAVESQIEKLEQEKLITSKQMDLLRKELSAIPYKWAEQQLVEHQIKTSANMVEELSGLVESKNISRNIMTLQSSPLDQAITPIKPVRPKLLFYTISGALLGVFFGVASTLFFGFIRGLPVTRHYLELNGINVLSLRRSNPSVISSKMISHILLRQVNRFALIGENISDLSSVAASQLSGNGNQVVLIEIAEKKQLDASEGFDYQFLDINVLNVLQLSQDLLSYVQRYDFVILCVVSPPDSLFVDLILDQCDVAFVAVSNQTTHQLKTLLERAKKQDVFLIL